VGVSSLGPLINFKLVGPNGSTVEDSGLIDTGADSSAFPLWMMDSFGISKEECEENDFDTSGGAAKQWVWQANGEDSFAATILDRRVRLKAVFTDTPVPLLGRDDFLACFKVLFAQRGPWYAIRPYRGVSRAWP
jgi:hypothetical protein